MKLKEILFIVILAFCLTGCTLETTEDIDIDGATESTEQTNSESGTTSNTACSYVLNHSTTMVRLISCKSPKYACGLDEANKRLPGGAQSEKVNISGSSVYIAKNAITLEQYIKGVSITEMGPNNNIEALKFQMLMALSNLLYSVDKYSSFINAVGEIQVETGSCFQSYRQERYDKYYTNGQYKSKIDTAYDAVKDELLIDNNGGITNANYLDHFQVALQEAADSGLTYDQLLTYSKVKADNQYKYYENSSIKSCISSAAQQPVQNVDTANALIANARKYIDKSREQMAAIVKGFYTIESDTSWCAIFVSYILKETMGSDIYFKSKSVSEFMKYYINNNRFCHSQYWYEKTGKWACSDSPQPGDIILFAKTVCEYSGDGNMPSKSDGCFRHIGIVSEVKDGKVYYVHGNTSRCNKYNGVCESSEKLNDPYIVGYGR